MNLPVPTPPDAELPASDGLRGRILALAIETLRAEGAEGLTMRSLAAPLGYSPATLYLHFRSKAELLDEVAARGFEALADALEPALAEPDPERALVRGAQAYLRFGLEDPHMYQLMFHRRPTASAQRAGSEAGRRLLGQVETVLDRVARPEAGGSSKERLGQVWSFLHGWLGLAGAGLLRSSSPQEAAEGVARQAVSALGLQAPAGSAGHPQKA